MKLAVCSLAALLLLAAPLLAVYDGYHLRENNFYMTITNCGSQGYLLGDPNAGCFWPAPAVDDSGNPVPPLMNYIYGWGLWIGAQLPGSGKMDTLVSAGYDPNSGAYEFTPGAVFGGVPQDPNEPDVRIYRSIEPGWPLHKTNGQDSVLSMLDTRCVYNDWLVSQHQAGGRPLKVEVNQATYQWNVAGLRDIIFFLWVVKNTGADTLRDAYLAPFADCDIGNESGGNANDLCGVDTTADLAYQFQRDSTEGDWPRNAGCVGFCFLRGPVATKDFAFPDSFHISAGDTLGLNVFHVSNIGNSPNNDIDQYKNLAGYNHQTCLFNRLDSSYIPGDYRFLLSSGPVDIPPGETANTIVSVMCADVDYSFLPGDPLAAISALRQKANDSRSALLGTLSGTTQVSLTSPLGGEVLTGTHAVTWTYSGNAQPTDSVDLYYRTGDASWDTVAVNLPNSGSYNWNTATVPDGVRYRACAVLHAQGRLACSQSQDFVIDNPGNAAPELAVLPPESTMTGVYSWRWLAGDAEGDTLSFNLYVQRQGNTAWTKAAGPISSDTCNTRVWRQYQYDWDTDTMMFSSYQLMVECSDGSALVQDSSVLHYPLYNPHAVNPAELDSGFSNFPFGWYLLNQANLTGHTYRARFKPIVRGPAAVLGTYPAEYKYDFWDATDSTFIFGDRAVPYFGGGPAFYYYDEGDLLYGFVPTCGDTGFKPRLANVDSIVRPAWSTSVDTLFAEHLTNPGDFGWACLNTPLEVRWHVDGTYPNDTLHAKVWDVAYNVQIPLDTTRLDQLTAISWMFGGTGAAYGRSIVCPTTAAATRMYLNLCGYRLYFNKGASTHQMTWATHPQEGDVWRLYFSGDVPPRLGDVFSFTPTGIAGGPGLPAVGGFVLSQNLPNPFRQLTTISYQITKPGLARLRIYNVAGQMVRTLVDDLRPAGSHSARWDGRDERGRLVSSGVYLYRLSASGSTKARKMTLIR